MFIDVYISNDPGVRRKCPKTGLPVGSPRFISYAGINSRIVLIFGLLFSGVLFDIARLEAAELSLARPFTDHMVVQRNVELPLWGKANARQAVEARIGRSKRQTVADEDGNWRVTFPAFEASPKPLTIEVRSGKQSLIVRDVLVGEVWLCSGQSNMEWPVSSSASAKEAVATANNPLIRLLNFRGESRRGAVYFNSKMLKNMTVEKFYKGKWELCSAETVKPFSAVGYYFGVALQRELDVPIGLIKAAIGGTPAEAWVRREALAAHPQLKSLVKGNWLENERLCKWCRERAVYNLSQVKSKGGSIPDDDLGPNHPFKPAFLWEAAIAPLVPFPIRGVIWYQGESNATTPERIAQHDQLFPLLIRDWRAQWGQGDFPFLFVQLPGIKRPHWPAFRESQRRTLESVKNTGMAVTIDIGQPKNVHPTTKRPVGRRLALWALGTTYGRSDIIYSGPLYRGMEVRGNAVIIQFDHVGKGLRTTDGKPVVGVELAGGDGKFHPASAVIEGDRLVVKSDSLSRPQHVRYGWQSFPNPPLNLVNDAMLPASPFTTVKQITKTQ